MHVWSVKIESAAYPDRESCLAECRARCDSVVNQRILLERHFIRRDTVNGVTLIQGDAMGLRVTCWAPAGEGHDGNRPWVMKIHSAAFEAAEVKALQEITRVCYPPH